MPSRLQSETARFRQIWTSPQETVGTQIIQNNFEHPALPVLGSLDSVSYGGQTRFVCLSLRERGIGLAICSKNE